jgi:hypothetical protein
LVPLEEGAKQESKMQREWWVGKEAVGIISGHALARVYQEIPWNI